MSEYGRVSLAIDASAARVGGGASRIYELASTLAALAPERRYLFAVARRIKDGLADVPPRSDFILIPGSLESAPTRMIWQQLWLPIALRRYTIDWILSPFNVLAGGPALRGAARSAVIVSNIAPVALSSFEVGTYRAARNRLLKTLTYRSLAQADHVFLLSNDAHRLLRDRLSANVTFLPMAPPSPSILQQSEAVRLPSRIVSRPFFLVVGDLIRNKGTEDAIRAMAHLSPLGHDIQLIIAGAPVDKVYAAALSALVGDAPGSVRFLGSVPHPVALALMRRTIATLLCSKLENPSRIPVEAFTVGSPLIVTDIPNINDSCGDAALYYKPGDHVNLATLMLRVLTDQRTRDALVSRGRQRIAGIDWLASTRAILQALGLL